MTAGPRAVAVVGSLAVMGTLLAAPAAGSDAGSLGSGRYDRPNDRFMPSGTVLDRAAPEQVGLDPARIDALTAAAAAYTEPSADTDHPLYASEVVLAAHDGHVVAEDAAGWSLRYADGDGTELPADERVPAQTDTIYDLASVSKLFTTIVVLQQVEAGLVELDTPVVEYLPDFGTNGKQDITVRQLLTHTSGLVPFLPLWRDWATIGDRIDAVLNTTPENEPGTAYVYSDLNMITAGLIAEEVTGEGLDELVRRGITEPLGMIDTGYNPSADLSRIAATEYQAAPDRGMVHGEVHDENAWSLGGVAGHAGVFGTADDLARLAQAILNGGVYDGARILESATVSAMLTDENTDFPDDAHGLGFELDQRWYMDALAAPSSAGHTGYTGTSMVIDPTSRSFVILLSNRVHPSREWGSINPARQAVAHQMAYSLAVGPKSGDASWAADDGGSSESTLDLPVRLQDSSRLTFDLFVDTESTDPLSLEMSTDGGSSWDPVPFAARRGGAEITAADGWVSGHHDRQWWRASAELDDVTADAIIRWRYNTDEMYEGRGVYVDDVKVRSRGLPTFHGERNPEAFTADGWSQRSR